MSEQAKVRGSDGPSMARLRAWAEARGLEVAASSGTQREPENIVAVKRGGEIFGSSLISRSSRDSIETAAFYLVNALELLGVDVPPSPPAGESS